jgi:hypothetical protein
MLGHHEDITNVDFTLTEPSQMIGGKPEGGERWLAQMCKPRRGKLRSLLGADCGFAGFRKAGESQQDVPSALITYGIREGKFEEVSQFIRVGVG